MLLRIGTAAPQALFLVGEGDHANRARRTPCLRQCADQVPGRHRDGHARAIVDRAGAEIPGIQVAADHHHFVRLRTAGDFTDHVLRGVFAFPAAVQLELHPHRAACSEPGELVRIRQRQRRRGNRRKPVLEPGHAGMRIAMRIGAGRTHQVADRAGLDRRGWAGAAHASAGAVAAAVLRPRHPIVDEGNLAGQRTGCGLLQRVQRFETHHLGFHAATRAAAECGDVQRLHAVAQHVCRLAAAYPLGEARRLGPDLVVAKRLELRHRPRHRARIGLAAGQARADVGGQRFHHLPAGVVGERGDAQRGSLRHRGIVDARGRLRQQRRCNQQGQGSGEQGAAHRAVPETTKPRV